VNLERGMRRKSFIKEALDEGIQISLESAVSSLAVLENFQLGNLGRKYCSVTFTKHPVS